MGKRKMTPADLDALMEIGFTERQIKSFHNEIYDLRKTGLTLIESLSHYCDERGVSVEDVAPLVKNNAVMHADLTIEASKLRLINIGGPVDPVEFE